MSSSIFNIYTFYTVIVFLLFWLLRVLVIFFEKHNKVDYGHRLANALMGFNQLICRRFHRMGDFWLNLPHTGGVIIAANHQSGIDVAALMAASKRPVRFLASSYYCDMPILNRIFKYFGCIPVYRDKDNKIALQAAVQALKQGEVICIFPFGGLHAPSKDEPRIRSGVAVLSKLANTSIHPIYIDGVAKFAHDKVFTSLFFARSTLKLTQYKPILNSINNTADNKLVLDYLYELLSNHNDKSDVESHLLDNILANEIDIQS